MCFLCAGTQWLGQVCDGRHKSNSLSITLADSRGGTVTVTCIGNKEKAQFKCAPGFERAHSQQLERLKLSFSRTRSVAR